MKSKGSHRTERVGSVVKRAVAVIIDTQVADPRVHGVSVVDAVVSGDLKYATVYVYIEGDDTEVLAALNNSAGFVRRLMAEQLRDMRVIPRLKFEIDKSQSYYEHIDALIKGLHKNDGNDK